MDDIWHYHVAVPADDLPQMNYHQRETLQSMLAVLIQTIAKQYGEDGAISTRLEEVGGDYPALPTIIITVRKLNLGPVS